MSEEKGYQGWTNYPTWCIHLWITSDNQPYIYWTKRAQKLLNQQEHATLHLRDALRAHFEDAMPALDGMWSDLMTNALKEVNWQEIAEAILKRHGERR
jgi:hypothetical protein